MVNFGLIEARRALYWRRPNPKHFTIMRHFIALAFCLMTAPAIFAGEPQLNGTATDLTEFLKGVPKIVTLTGESEVRIQADEAIISLSVRSEQKTLEGALKQNEELRNKIASLLSQRGLAADSIKAAKFSSTPKTGMFSDKAKSYLVENSVKITVRTDQEFQAVANVVDTMADVRYLGIDFEHTDKDAVKAKALAEACDKASAKRKLVEEKFGIKLVPQKLSEGTRLDQARLNQAVMRAAVAGIQGGVVSSTAPSFTGPSGVFPSQAMEGGASSFGELVYSAVVIVDYAVEK
jgi:uncharacterized protein YggE